MITQKIKNIRKKIDSEFVATVFGSSVLGDELLSEEYLENKLWLNFIELLSECNVSILNGGYQASMSMIANEIIKQKGKCYGIVSASFSDPCIKEHYTDLFTVKDAFDRLKTLICLADLYIFLPGGVGSMAELTCALWCIDREFISPKKMYFLGDYWKNIINTMCSKSLMFKKLEATNVIKQYSTPQEFISSLRNDINAMKENNIEH